jgi:hypothetical protein
MTVPRWTRVHAEYPSAAFEIGPEDLRILFNALRDHEHYYELRQEVGGEPRDESVRIKAMLQTLNDLRRELDMQVNQARTIKTVTAIP